MTCPNCGLQSLSEQKFCRSCGASLRLTTQPLAEPSAISDLQRTSTLTHGHQRANSFVLWGFIIMLVGAAIGVIGKKLMHEDVVTVVGILISLAGMFLTVYPFLAPPRAKRKVGQAPEPEVLTQAQPAKALPQESNAEYVPSITERTTDLLASATKKTRNVGSESKS
jgi:hypothetical protein